MVKTYTSEEVALHCTVDDCWVAIFNNVFDITKLIEENKGPLADPLIKQAGQSITHWFDPKTKQLKTYIDEVRNIRVPYTPEGRFIHVPPADPVEWDTTCAEVWWEDPQYIIGRLTERKRMVRVINMLSTTEDIISTCAEDTVDDILEKYLEYNAHARSYTWKAIANDALYNLDMSKTLEENGVVDESELFYDLSIPDDAYIPSVMIYFNDDLTYA